MIQPRHLLLCTSALLLSAACKHTGSSAAVKAQHEDRAPEDGQSWTEARVITLNEYAADLLKFDGNESKRFNELQLQIDESFKQAGVKNPEPLSVYRITLGPVGECFNEGTLNTEGLWYDKHKEQIKQQVEYAAYFIRDVHYRLFGRSGGALGFREVKICPEDKVGAKMRLEGYQLYIGVPFSKFAIGKYEPIPNRAEGNAVSLERLWSSGAPIGLGGGGGLASNVKSLFSKEEKARQALALAWKTFEPLAPMRMAVRKALHENGATLNRRLASISSGPVADDSDTVARFRASVLRDNLDEAEIAAVAPDLKAAYDKLDAAGLRLALANWACFVDDPVVHFDLEGDAMMVAQDYLKTSSVTKDVEAGLVAVVNHHDVAVTLTAGAGTYKKYVESGYKHEMTLNTKVRAGLVAVDTSDNITVDVRLLTSLGRSLQRAGFDRSVSAAAGGRSLCAPPATK